MLWILLQSDVKLFRSEQHMAMPIERENFFEMFYLDDPLIFTFPR